MFDRRKTRRLRAAALAATLAVFAAVAPVAWAHLGGKPITVARAQSELVANGMRWSDDAAHTITSARCAGEGTAVRRQTRRLYRHFRCSLTTRETLQYRIRLHYIGSKDRLYTAEFLGWTSGVGSRERPVPVGTAAPVGNGWTAKVLSVRSDAAAEVAAYQQSLGDDADRVAVQPGNQLVLARVAVTRTAPSPRSLDDLELHVVGASSVVSRHSGCGSFADRLPYLTVFPGGTIEGNLCWQMPAGDLGSLVMFDEFAPPYLFLALVP